MTSINFTQSHVRVPSSTNRRLWIAQGIVAAIFLFAGGMKLLTPADVLAAQSHFPGAFMKFIGVCETLGALGLVLPGLLHVQSRLTPLAATGLVVIMIGAVVTSIIQGLAAVAVIPAIVGALALYAARGRAR